MSEVRVKEGESLENALKRFKRSCAKAGVIAEVKKREHYVSPSLKRKQKSEAARKNRKKFYCPFPVHKTENAPCRRTERFSKYRGFPCAQEFGRGGQSRPPLHRNRKVLAASPQSSEGIHCILPGGAALLPCQSLVYA